MAASLFTSAAPFSLGVPTGLTRMVRLYCGKAPALRPSSLSAFRFVTFVDEPTAKGGTPTFATKEAAGFPHLLRARKVAPDVTPELRMLVLSAEFVAPRMKVPPVAA